MNIDAFILIGGRSSRLGTDKVFAGVDGETLAERTARTVKTAFVETQIKLVAASDGQFDNQLLLKLGFPVIYDQKPGFGAWSGIHAALAEARSEWIFVSACDLPFVSPEFLQFMASLISSDNDAIVSRQPDGRLQPLYAFYRVGSSLAVANKILNGGGHLPPLSATFEPLKTRVIEPDEYKGLENSDKFFLNINTVADLAAVETHHKVTKIRKYRSSNLDFP